MAAGAAVAALAVKSIQSAADLGESINKAGVVFGRQRRQILRWSTTTADSFGIARAEALEAAAGFGNMLKTSGLAGEASADMSQRLVELAADMASLNNQDPSEMLDKLRSGLAGEAEPLRRFGILLSEAALQTEAVRAGIAAQGEELTDAEKVQARFNVIMRQSRTAHGDFARTAESLPNLLRRLRARWEDLQAMLGRRLLPVAEKVVSWLVDRLPGAFAVAQRVMRRVGGVIGGVRDAFSGIADSARSVQRIDWRDIGAAIAGFIPRAADLALDFAGALMNRLLGIDWAALGKRAVTIAIPFVIGFVSALLDPGVWLPILREHWKDILGLLLAVGFAPARWTAGIGRALSKIPLVGRLIAWFFRGFVAVGRWLTTPVRALFSRFAGLIGGAVSNITGRVVGFFSRLGDDIVLRVYTWADDLVIAAGRIVGRFARAIWDGLRSLADDVVQWLRDLPGRVASGAGAVGRFIADRLPGFQHGGWAPAMTPFVVGERGPEVLMMPSPSLVIPNDRVPDVSGGGLGTTITATIVVQGVSDPDQAARQVVRRLRDLEARH